jgi:hypothetical protein
MIALQKGHVIDKFCALFSPRITYSSRKVVEYTRLPFVEIFPYKIGSTFPLILALSGLFRFAASFVKSE